VTRNVAGRKGSKAKSMEIIVQREWRRAKARGKQRNREYKEERKKNNETKHNNKKKLEKEEIIVLYIRNAK